MSLAFTDTSDGDLAVTSEDVDRRRARVDDRPWSWLRQVHGTRVAVVTSPGEHAGEEGDALVSDTNDVVLAVQGADCAPLLFWSDEGPVGAAHAGWRGLEAGVVGATADAMRSLGATTVHMCVGPCIHPSRYEFGADELDRLTRRFGDLVRGETVDGSPALDVPALIRAVAGEADVTIDHELAVCTGSSPAHYSHRVRRDNGRHAGVVVRDAEVAA